MITTPFTFVATANAIIFCGARPVFADIDEFTFNLSPAAVVSKITPRTKAILAVDLYGLPFAVPELRQLARQYKLVLVEDAAQSIGASYQGQLAGTLGQIATFSFYATKNITCGEGGMITTNNKKWAQQARMFRHHGQAEKRYEYITLGYNFRLTDIQAAILREQLKRVKEFNKQRERNAKIYSEILKDCRGIILPLLPPGYQSSFHQYTIRVTEKFPLTRDALRDYLKKKGVMTGVYYPRPLHLHRHFRRWGYKQGDLPVAERLAKEVLSLPVHPAVRRRQVVFIAKLIKQAAEQ